MTAGLNHEGIEPRAQRPAEVERLAGFLSAVLADRSAVYVSAPITSGRRHSEWHPAEAHRLSSAPADYWQAHRAHVVEPNRNHAKEVVARIRLSERRPVIDPTAVPDIDGWTQDDYRLLWARVIERYAALVVFLDGWEYSNGCTYEFLVAQRLALPTATEAGRPLTLAAGGALIRGALANLAAQGVEAALPRWVLSQAERLVRARRRPDRSTERR